MFTETLVRLSSCDTAGTVESSNFEKLSRCNLAHREFLHGEHRKQLLDSESETETMIEFD